MTAEPHVLPQFKHCVPCCTAKSKQTGRVCRQPAMKHGKCRLHGGKSTGAKTAEGKLRRDRAPLKHGFYSKVAREERKALKSVLRDLSQSV